MVRVYQRVAWTTPILRFRPKGSWQRPLQAIGLAVVLSVTASPARSQTESVGVQRKSVGLAVLEGQLRRLFPELHQIRPDDVDRLMRATPHQVVVLDVRTAVEFEVSHIAGAIQVDPGVRRTRDIALSAGGLEGKIVIAYCSIGLRSARVLVRLNQALRDRGVIALYNLEGGIFRWRNEQRGLVNAVGPTREIDPYNALWRPFLLD